MNTATLVDAYYRLREEVSQLQIDVSNLQKELEQSQVKWRLFFGSDQFRHERAVKGAQARWAGHQAKRPRRSRDPLAGFDPFEQVRPKIRLSKVQP